MKTLTMVVFAALVAALTLAGTTRADWQDFAKDGFSVQLPGSPTTQEKTIPSVAGNMEMKMHIAKGDGLVCVVVTMDLPLGFAGLTEADILNSARDGVVSGLDGKVSSETNITVGKYAGRDIHGEALEGKGDLRVQLIAAGKRVYALVVVFPKGADVSTETAKFLGSFQVN
jgi:hypothetical protein